MPGWIEIFGKTFKYG